MTPASIITRLATYARRPLTARNDLAVARLRQTARDAADAYDKRIGHDWTEYGLIDAVLAAVIPATRETR